jgi:hypothetical protein
MLVNFGTGLLRGNNRFTKNLPCPMWLKIPNPNFLEAHKILTISTSWTNNVTVHDVHDNEKRSESKYSDMLESIEIWHENIPINENAVYPFNM